MTLVMTELRDDIPPGPDPNFNPNLFSEDEEESLADRNHKVIHTDNFPPIAPILPNNHRVQKPEVQTIIPTTSTIVPALARAESYEDLFPYVDFSEMVNFCEALTSKNKTRTAPHGSGKHVVSPLRCEASVPQLQSPKNAVAPSDIIFDRPPAHTFSPYSSPEYATISPQPIVNRGAQSSDSSSNKNTFHFNKNSLPIKKNYNFKSTNDNEAGKSKNFEVQSVSSSSSSSSSGAPVPPPKRRTFCNKNSPSGNQIGIASTKWTGNANFFS